MLIGSGFLRPARKTSSNATPKCQRDLVFSVAWFREIGITGAAPYLEWRATLGGAIAISSRSSLIAMPGLEIHRLLSTRPNRESDQELRSDWRHSSVSMQGPTSATYGI